MLLKATMIQTKKFIVSIALCTSSLMFSMKPEDAKYVKVASLQELATQAILKNPRAIIGQENQITPACKLILHETLLREALKPSNLNPLSSHLYSMLAKQEAAAYGIWTAIHKDSKIRNELGITLSKYYENASLSQLCLLSTIEKEQTKLELTIDEAKLFNDLSPELKNEFARLVIQPGLWQRLIYFMQKTAF